MRNCKVGDLAIIVRDNDKMENLGLIVRIVSAYGDIRWLDFNKKAGRYYKRKYSTLFSWTVQVVSDTSQIIYADSEHTLYGEMTGEVPDTYLRPLTALSDDESLGAYGLTPRQYDLAVEAVKESLRMEESGS